MSIEIGQVDAIFRYPVKSMAGQRLQDANLGWYGVEGDRRLGFRRVDERGGMPWLTAGKAPNLLLFTPQHLEGKAADVVPAFVRTPDGQEFPAFGEDLAKEVERRFGVPVQMTHLRHGIFDEANISVIAFETVEEIGRLSGTSLDPLQFRPNVVVRLRRPAPFQEDNWLGGVLSFGDGIEAPTIAVTMRDERCGMVNFDPNSAKASPEVLKAIVRINQNHAGIYGAVTRRGSIKVGQRIFFRTGLGELA